MRHVELHANSIQTTDYCSGLFLSVAPNKELPNIYKSIMLPPLTDLGKLKGFKGLTAEVVVSAVGF